MTPAFFNRFGQLIYREPAGRFASYEHPQFSIHRGDLQGVLLSAVIDRLGAERLSLDHTGTGVIQDENGVTLTFRSTSTDLPLPSARADIVVACDGIHSKLRRQLHPDEGPPLYSGVNMWRGTVVHPPFLRNALAGTADPAAALRAYEAARLPATAAVVRTNRATPPDAILREVWQRTGDRPFTRIEDVIELSELRGISERYKDVAGFSREALESL
jgi:2-polyprenyl-6-methoxyphenol hydroxylase-like FAD-dependent oxidoreductase